MAVKKVKGICGICPDKCDILATVEDGRLIKIEPDREAPRGRLCPRGALAPEIIYHEKRILHPLIRTGERGSGQFREASFEEALDYAAEKIKEVVKNYGPDALVSYVGTAGREPSSMRCFGGKDAFFGHLGGINDTTCGSTCNFASYVMAPVTVFGINQTNIVQDFAHTELIFIWGKNPATDSGYQTLYNNIRAARKRGARVVVIDPRGDCNNGEYDEWIPVIPGTDGAMILAMTKLALESGRYDKAFAEEYMEGLPEYQAYLDSLSLAELSETCGVPLSDIRRLTEELLEKPAALIAYTGLEYQLSAIQNNRAAWILWALCGKMDTPGGMLFTGTGYETFQLHPLPEGKKPIGCRSYPLYYMMSGSAQLGEDFLTGVLEDDPYPIRGYLLCAGATSLTFPEQKRWEEAYRKLDIFIVLERFMSNDARFADVIFPSTTYFEDESIVDVPGGKQLRRRIIDPVGEARTDTFILQALAERLGFGDAYPKNDKEMLLWLAKGDETLVEKLRNTQYGLLREPNHDLRKYETGQLRKDGKKGFPTPSGKIEIRSSLIESAGLCGMPVYHDIREIPAFGTKEEFPMMLTTGARSRIRFSAFGPNLPEIAKVEPDPLLSISREDAEAQGIQEGDQVLVETAFGKETFPAHICKMAKGCIHIPFGGGSPYMLGGWKEGNVNRLASMRYSDPVSGFISYKSIPCRIRKAEEAQR